jgi:hypothetical protein
LRHLFLFNDVLVCAKYKAANRGEKFTFQLKWHIPLSEVSMHREKEEGNKSVLRIRIRDPGLGAFLTLKSVLRIRIQHPHPGSEIRDEQPGSYF